MNRLAFLPVWRRRCPQQAVAIAGIRSKLKRISVLRILLIPEVEFVSDVIVTLMENRASKLPAHVRSEIRIYRLVIFVPSMLICEVMFNMLCKPGLILLTDFAFSAFENNFGKPYLSHDVGQDQCSCECRYPAFFRNRISHRLNDFSNTLLAHQTAASASIPSSAMIFITHCPSK